MANTDKKRVSLAEAIRASEANLLQMEQDLGLLQALEQDRRAAALRMEIAAASEHHKRLVCCAEAGCQCADDCKCGASCACAA